MTRRPSRAVTMTAVAALTTSTALATLVTAAGPAAAKAKVVAPVWTQLSAGQGVSISNQPRVVRWHGKLVVVWAQDDDTSHQSIHTRILGTNAKPIGGISNVVSAWSSVSTDPTVLLLGGVPTVAFGGLHSLESSDVLNGPMVYAQAADAKAWALGPGSLTQNRSVYGDYGFGVVDDGNGQPVSAGAYSSSDHLTIHHGIDPTTPATAPDQVTSSSTGETQQVNVAKDSKTGAVYAAWYSGVSDPAQQGIHAAEVYPGISAPSAPAPFSTVNFMGGKSSVNPSQDIALSSRVGGGVWAAYASGYPSPTKLVLWNLQTGRTLSLKTSSEIQYVNLSQGPGGRLWVSWIQGGTVYAARTNPSVTKFGIVRSVVAPGGSSVTRTAGDGSLGPLDVIINQAKGFAAPEIKSTRILEALRVAVSPAKVSYAKGGTVVVTVTDAGLPVPGVAVTVGGVTKHTNAKGKVSFAVARHAAKGSHVVTASSAGWWPGSTSFKVG
jgi:hypothetical protein